MDGLRATSQEWLKQDTIYLEASILLSHLVTYSIRLHFAVLNWYHRDGRLRLGLRYSLSERRLQIPDR